MAHTHEFDCKICNAHLDSRSELDQHNREQHTERLGKSSSGISNAGEGRSQNGSQRSSGNTDRIEPIS